MARDGCAKCNQLDHHRPDCPELFWPDGRPRGIPGPPPLKTLTLDEEMGQIFAGTTEAMMVRHQKAMRERGLT